MAAFLRAAPGPRCERGDPRLLVFADRADHVDRIAVAGVGIGDDRDADRLDRQPDKADILRKGEQAEIGIAVGPRIAAAGQIDRLEPSLLDEPRRQSVLGPGRHRVAAAGDQRFHLLRGVIGPSFNFSSGI